MITSRKNYLCIGPLTATVHVADIFKWATDRFTKVTYQSIHDECRYIDTRVFTLEELLKEDIPKSTAWFALRIREGAMYAVLTEIRVTEGTIVRDYLGTKTSRSGMYDVVMRRLFATCNRSK